MEERFRPEIETAIFMKRQFNSIEERMKNFEETLTNYRSENRRILGEIDNINNDIHQIKKELKSILQNSSSTQKIEVSKRLLDELR